MENCIPEFWEREREWKIAFPTFGNGNEKLIPKLWEREWEVGIPGNGREREFPLTPAGQLNRNLVTLSYLLFFNSKVYQSPTWRGYLSAFIAKTKKLKSMLLKT